jgi:hypothetical protein
MKEIPSDCFGRYDFVWSTSSLEHLGSLAEAERFIEQSIACLKPGGVAVHVTEHAIFPGRDVDNHGTVYFSLDRIRSLLQRLGGLPLREGYGVSPVDYYVDAAPYGGAAHMKLLVDGVVTTSVGLIFKR